MSYSLRSKHLATIHKLRRLSDVLRQDGMPDTMDTNQWFYPKPEHEELSQWERCPSCPAGWLEHLGLVDHAIKAECLPGLIHTKRSNYLFGIHGVLTREEVLRRIEHTIAEIEGEI